MRALEKEGLFLCGGDDRSHLLVVLGEERVGRPLDRAVGGLGLRHEGEERVEAFLRPGEVVADGGEGAALFRLLGGGEHDKATHEGSCAFLEMLVACVSVDDDQGACERCGIVGEIRIGGIEILQRIVGGTFLSGHTERIDDVDGTEMRSLPCGDPGVLALRIDDENGAIGGDEVRNDEAGALARTRRGKRQEMPVAVVVVLLFGVQGSVDRSDPERTLRVLAECLRLGVVGKAGAAMRTEPVSLVRRKEVDAE